MKSDCIVEEIPFSSQDQSWKDSPFFAPGSRQPSLIVEEFTLPLFHDNEVLFGQSDSHAAPVTIVTDVDDNKKRVKPSKKERSDRTSASAKQDALQIKTPQALIHIRHSISLLQYKYWILMIHEMRRQMSAGIPADEHGFRSISISDIATALNYTPNKTELWEDMQALKNETIAYNVLGKDGQPAKYGSGFITEWKVYATRVEYKFPSFIEDVVRGLEESRAIFQILNWEIFNHFSGKYSAIIYKFCRDYRGVKKTPYQTLGDFRNYMGLQPHEYKEFRDLNKFVISGPVKTINSSEASDIHVEVDFERQGRKVIGLRFLIEPKAQTILPLDPFETSEAFRFAKVYIEPATQKKYLALRNEREIELCIERANEYGEQQARKGAEPNFGALYRTAIQEGWHVQQLELKMQEQKRTERRQAGEKKQQEELAVKEAASAAELARINDLLDRFDQLPDARQVELRAAFRESIANIPPLKKAFDKQGERANLVSPAFANFIAEFVADSGLASKPVRRSSKTNR